jgi:RNA polymerase-associated protein CTR9
LVFLATDIPGRLFAELASDPANVVPYSKEMADQRRKYGEGMLRKGDEHLATQRQHDEESRVRIDAARQKRQEERDRLQQIEVRRRCRPRASAMLTASQDLRLEELRIAADKLAEERRIARQQAQEWTAEARAESDEERERKASKRASRKARPADGGASGDEGESGPGQKRKRSRKKKTEQDGEDEEALFSAPEDDGAGAGAEKPKKVSKRETCDARVLTPDGVQRGAKKRVVKDEDEEEPAGPPRKKQMYVDAMHGCTLD